MNIGIHGPPSWHSWHCGDKEFRFDDEIIVSDETVPPPDPDCDGMSVTLWTKAHERNALKLNGQKSMSLGFFRLSKILKGSAVHVSRNEFSWNLSMSQKLNENNEVVGPFKETDMEVYYHDDNESVESDESDQNEETEKRYKLFYKLIWNITEMQVKPSIMAQFPGVAIPTIQLAQQKEQVTIRAHETKLSGESRSKALNDDIEITAATSK